MAKFITHSKNRPIPRLEPRVTALTVIILAVLTGAATRLYYLQMIKHHEMAELADRNRIRLQRQPALSGLVYDVRHRALVDTRPSFDAVMVPEDAPDLNVTTARLE